MSVRTVMNSVFNRRHGTNWSMYGSGWRRERRVFWVWFYRNQLEQRWSPKMTEITREYGIRIRHIRLSWSHTRKHFKDNKVPKSKPSIY